MKSLRTHLNPCRSSIIVAGWALCALLAVQASPSAAFQLFDSPSPKINHNAQASAILDSPQVIPGESFDLYVRITLRTGWHIYSLESQGDGEDLATVIHVDEKFFRGQGKWKEPDPEIILDQALNKIVKTHHGTIEFRRTYQAAVSLKPGTYLLKGAVLFRACDNRVCTLPNEVPFSTQVTVVDGMH